MEHVPGHSCAELLRDHGPMEVEQAVDVITQACRGLDYAHRNGVVHRDVKPGNLLVSDSDVVKLADFGIARATDQSSITQVGSVLGTAAYLAPEQARGEEAGPRADLYSLGVVAYQLLDRTPALRGELAVRARAQAAARAAATGRRAQPHGSPRSSPTRSGWRWRSTRRSGPRPRCCSARRSPAGARGVEPTPNGSRTRTLGGTAATRVLSGQGAPTAQTRVAPRTPPPTGTATNA